MFIHDIVIELKKNHFHTIGFYGHYLTWLIEFINKGRLFRFLGNFLSVFTPLDHAIHPITLLEALQGIEPQTMAEPITNCHWHQQAH